MHDLVDDTQFGLEPNKDERQGGIWNYQDAQAAATCGNSDQPFTGEGYESNYDGGTFVGDPDDYPVVDPFCENGECDTLKFPTTLDPGFEAEDRTLDIGDMLPYHWEETNRNELFRRMAPNWVPGLAIEQLDFSTASYFRDVPNAEGFLEFVNPNRRPLVPYGASPVGSA